MESREIHLCELTQRHLLVDIWLNYGGHIFISKKHSAWDNQTIVKEALLI